jgi:hypothetical protein
MRPWFCACLALLLTACSANRPVDEAAKGSSGPTIYGKLHVSIDHVSTR